MQPNLPNAYASPAGLNSYSNVTEPTASNSALYIFPPSSTHTLVQHPQPTHMLPNIFSPLTGPTPIFVHFRGRRAYYRYSRNAPPGLSPPAPRLALSMWTHLRLSGTPVLPPLPTDPSTCIAEGTQIDLCYVDFAVDMNEYPTRTDFGLMLQRLAPTAGAQNHFVEEWDIACRRCGKLIRQYYTDEFWNGRYLLHRVEPQCKNREGEVYQRHV